MNFSFWSIDFLYKSQRAKAKVTLQTDGMHEQNPRVVVTVGARTWWLEGCAWCGEEGGAPAEGGAEPPGAGDPPPQLPGEHAPPPALPDKLPLTLQPDSGLAQRLRYMISHLLVFLTLQIFFFFICHFTKDYSTFLETRTLIAKFFDA